jgi:hypothetical protein
MEIKAIRCFLGSSRAAKAGTGIIRIAMSVAICIDAFENQSPFELRQEPAMVGSQNLATGMQFRKALRTAHEPYMTSTPIMARQVWRMPPDGKTRKYCMRIEAFAQSKAAL